MGADTDFNALYRELGVSADCDIGQFRQAYRRCVSRLHPDHQGCDGGLARLQQLNRLFARATEFHRQHGRLPGAAGITSARPLPASASGAACVADAPAPMAGTRHRARYSVLVALVTVTLWWLYQSNMLGPRVVRGMGAGDVRAIQGEPSAVTGTRWEYGPSWVEFQCGEVVDWYSAPQQPLRVDDEPSDGSKPKPSVHAFGC